MQGDVYRLSAVECDRRQILVEERLEHDDFVPVVQKRRKHGVLSCSSWWINGRWPRKYRILHAFISPAGDKDLRFDIEVPVELRSIELFDCLAQTRAPFGVRVVVCSYGTQSLRRRVGDPFRRRKIHVPLTEIKAICGQVGGTISRQRPVIREQGERLT